jgi:hypothetical protein
MSDLVRQVFHALDSPRGEEEIAALLGEPPRGRGSEPRRCTCDENALACESVHELQFTSLGEEMGAASP